MKTARLTAIFLAFFLLGALSAKAATGGTAAFDNQMAPIYAEYVKIQQALAKDSIEGVAASAKKIKTLAAGLDPSAVTGEHAEHYKGLPGKLKEAAASLAAGKDITAMRVRFKALSKPMAMWATMSKPAKVNVVFCSMANAPWLQEGAVILNPYYGSSMPHCGEIVAGPDRKEVPK